MKPVKPNKTLDLLSANRACAAVMFINLLFCSYFLFLNCNTGLYVDDYGYMFAFSLGEKLTAERVTGLWSMLRSQYAHYFLMNGRSVAHALLQTALIGGRGLFSVVNTLAYLGFGLAGYLMIKPRERHSPLAQLGVYLLPWLLFPEFGLTHLLACGAANYLWTMTIILIFLLPFRYLFGGCDCFAKRKLVGAIVMAIGGIIAGWSSENGSAAMLFLIGCMGLYYLISRRPIPAWCLTGFGGALAGFAMMLCAPGYEVRTENALAAGQGESLYSRFVALLIDHTLPYFWYMLAALLCAAFLTYCVRQQNARLRLYFAGGCCGAAAFSGLLLSALKWLYGSNPGYVARRAELQLLILAVLSAYICAMLWRSRMNGGSASGLTVPLMLMATGAVATLAMLAVPIVQTRSEWQFFVFFTLGAVTVFERTIRTLTDMLPCALCVRCGLLGVMIVLSALSLTVAAARTDAYYEHFKAREAYIAQCVAAGELDVELPEMPATGDRRIISVNISDYNPDYWINQAFCRYYGLRAITRSE